MTTFIGFEESTRALALARQIASLFPAEAEIRFDRSFGCPTMTARWLIGGLDEDGTPLGWSVILIFGARWSVTGIKEELVQEHSDEVAGQLVFDEVEATIARIDLHALNKRRQAGEDIDDEIRMHFLEPLFD